MILVEQGDWPESRGLAVRRSGRLEADEKKKKIQIFVRLLFVAFEWRVHRLANLAAIDRCEFRHFSAD